jgi:hypothetical protein
MSRPCGTTRSLFSLGRLDLLAVVSTLVSRVAVRLIGCGITLAAPLCWLKRGG